MGEQDNPLEDWLFISEHLPKGDLDQRTMRSICKSFDALTKALGSPPGARLRLSGLLPPVPELAPLTLPPPERERALMLARLGRVDEAVQAGIDTLASPTDALALASALREGGQLDAALRVAEHGLGLDGPRGALGDWLASLAPGLGWPELALRAAEVACASEPSKARYLAACDLAGEQWPALRGRLLDQLRAGAGGWLGSRA